MHYKVLLLAEVNSTHIQKWATALAGKGVEVGIFSLSDCNIDSYNGKKNVTIFSTRSQGTLFNRYKGFYPASLPALKKVIKKFEPDIVHAHYATSYGLLGVLSRFHPFILSLWGSDIFEFPRKSSLHRVLLKNNLKRADILLSTSKAMALEAKRYTSNDIAITPFGVDTNVFKPMKDIRGELYKKAGLAYRGNEIVIGTVKVIEEKYGIKYLVQAFSVVKKKHPEKSLKLLIVGDGSKLRELKSMATELKIEPFVCFTGFVDYSKIPAYHNMIDISVYPSMHDSESFGVSALEAAACGNAVIASNVGGLPEVVEDGITGMLVPPANVDKLAEAIEKLVLNDKLRNGYGVNGRRMVEKIYEWDVCVKQMLNIYEGILKKK